VLVATFFCVKVKSSSSSCELTVTYQFFTYDCPSDRLYATYDIECSGGDDGCSGYITSTMYEQVGTSWIPIIYGSDCQSLNMDCGTSKNRYQLYVPAACSKLGAGTYKVVWGVYEGGNCASGGGDEISLGSFTKTFTLPCTNCVNDPE